MKTVSIIRNINEAKQLKTIDAFILPIKDFSINYENYFDITELKEIIKTNKEIFVSLNKNIPNSELKNLKQTLLEIEKLNIKGIIFYDIAIVNLKNELNLKTPLVWHQEHLTTNYATVNYWYEKGCKYAYLSSELTLKELKEIKQNTKSQIFVNVFGHLPMFTSKRHLVNNYTETFKIPKTNANKTLYKETKHYPISDTKVGTTVYSNYILNILDQDLNFIDYIVFNPYLIEEDDFEKVIYDYKHQNKISKYPYNHGFLYKKTIYKVKKNE